MKTESASVDCEKAGETLTHCSGALRVFRSLAATHLAAQHLLRGFGQIGDIARQFVQLFIAHSAILFREALPLSHGIDLHGQQYTARPGIGRYNLMIS